MQSKYFKKKVYHLQEVYYCVIYGRDIGHPLKLLTMGAPGHITFPYVPSIWTSIAWLMLSLQKNRVVSNVISCIKNPSESSNGKMYVGNSSEYSNGISTDSYH